MRDESDYDDCEGVLNGRPLPRVAGIVFMIGFTNVVDRFDSSDSDLRGLPLPLRFGGLIFSLNDFDKLLNSEDISPHLCSELSSSTGCSSGYLVL